MASEWHDARFAQLCEHSAFGPRFAGELYAPDGNVATLRTTDISADGRIEYETMPLARLDLSRLQQHTLRPKDLVITRSGRIGTAALFNGFRLPVLPGAFLIRFRLKTDVAEPLFYRYFFNSRAGQELLTSVATGSVQQNLNITSVHGLEVPVPPLADQRAIAHILGTLDDKIELNRRMNETLERQARALFKSWFVDFDPVRAKAEGRDPGLPKPLADLFPDSFEDSELGEIPKGWEVRPFAGIVEIIGGGTPKTSVAEYWDGEIPWFSVVDAPNGADVWVVDTEKKITREGVENSSTRILPVGTTIISARGTVGRIALVGVPMAMNQSCYGLQGKEDRREFFMYFATRELVACLRQHAHGSVFDTITRDTLAGVSVAAPSAELIEAFETRVGSSMERIRAGLFESRTLAALRDALLPKLISGELRVKDADDLVQEATV